MRVRSTSIIDAFKIVDLSDDTMYDLVRWVHDMTGGNVLTDRHGNHIHVRAKGFEFELYDAAMPIWLLCSGGNYFAFTDEEFHSNYEAVGSSIENKAERVAVQDELFNQKSTMGTIFQALVNSGLTRDQALDGLSEINKTGISFVEKSEIARSRVFQDLSPNCNRCWPGTASSKYPHQNHDTAEHDQWYKAQLGKETNDA